VAAAVTAASASANLYGVVTAVEAWSAGGSLPDGGTAEAESGNLYVQDPTSGSTITPKSGISVYLPKANAGTYGTVPALGDVVTISNLKWSPYGGQDQFEAAATTVVTNIGTSALPTPYMMPASVAASTGAVASGYEGMRVIVTGSFTVKGSETSNDCPSGVSYTDTGD
jgi:hypothetical protein